MKFEDVDYGMYLRVKSTGYMVVVEDIDESREEICISYLTAKNEDGDMWDTKRADELEYVPPYEISGDVAKKIIRFEYREAEIVPEGNVFENCTCSGGYHIVMEDILAGYKNIREKECTFDAVFSWCIAVRNISESIGLKMYYPGYCYENLDWDELITYSTEWIFHMNLGGYWIEDKIDINYLTGMIDNIGRLIAEKDVPLSEKWLPEDLERHIADRYDSDSLDKASEAAQKTYRMCLDRLCERKIPEYLQKKGYCIYCGTRVYPQNWPQARDIFLKYYELTGDASAANTLGYIFYYGRCTDGKPEYEKAFRYFSIGHAYGYYESTYKLADMFTHGYGVVKSPDTAFRMYQYVYNDNKTRFVQGDKKCKFADAALRMGNCYMNGTGTAVDVKKAYSYYLEADLAIRERVKYSDQYGDSVVYNGIKKALKEAREKYQEHKKTFKCKDAELFYSAISSERRAKIRWKRLAGGELNFTVKPLPNVYEYRAPGILLTIPEIDYCELKDRFTIKTNPGAEIAVADNGTEIVFNRIESDNRGKYEFYLYEKKVGTIYADEFIIHVPKKKKALQSGKLLKFVSIRFGAEGRTYDYITDIDGIQPGDNVIVNGYNGETRVEVVSVYEKYESETDLPAERYKKVIRRV